MIPCSASGRSGSSSESSSSDSTISTVHFPRGFRIPLFGIFLIQVLMVSGAFAAVVVILYERQQKDFELALHSQLAQQQSNAMDSIIGPLMSKSTVFKSMVSAFWNHHTVNTSSTGALRVVYNRPTAPSDSSLLEDAIPFYQSFYILSQEDQMLRMAAWANESTKQRLGADGMMKNTWSMFVTDRIKMAAVRDENISACLGPYPQASDVLTCPRTTGTFNAAEVIGHPDDLPLDDLRLQSSVWSRPGLMRDPVDSTRTLGVTFFTAINGAYLTRPYSAAALVFGLAHIKPIIANSTASTKSRAALFASYFGSPYVGHDQYLVTGVLDFPDFQPEETSNTSSWRAGETPDAVLNEAFDRAKSLCYPLEAEVVPQSGDSDSSNKTSRVYSYSGCPSPVVFDINARGSEYTVSVTRVLNPSARFDWMLIEYTPREVFYEASDRARLVGILIGVAGATIILVSCVAVWISVRSPLAKLQKNMNLAAMMRNEEVAEQRPILKEIGELVAAFNQMNARLLTARPFLPHTALLAQQEGGKLGVLERSISMMSIRSNRPLFGRINSDKYSDRSSGSEEDQEDSFRKGRREGRLGTSVPANEISYFEEDPAEHVVRLLAVDNGVSKTLNFSDSALRDHAIAFRLPGYEKKAQHNLQSADGGFLSPPLYLPTPQQIFNLFAVSLELRRIAVLAINVRGFHHYSSMGTSSEHFVRVHTALARLIESAVRAEKGVVDYFHGDRFICGFNTVKHALCNHPALSAAQAACGIWGQFKTDSLLFTALPSGLAMGMSTGKAEVGNHGTETMQRLGMIGPVFGEAVKLQEIMSRMVLGGCGRIWRKGKLTGQATANMSKNDLSKPPRKKRMRSTDLSKRFEEIPGDAQPQELPKLRSKVDAEIVDCLPGRCLVTGRGVQDIGGSMICQLLGAVDASHLLPSVDSVRRSVREEYAKARNNFVAHVIDNDLPGSTRSPKATPRSNQQEVSRKGLSAALAPRVLLAAIVSPKQVGVGDSGINRPRADGELNATQDAGWLYCPDSDSQLGKHPFAVANAFIYKLFLDGSSREGLEYFRKKHLSYRAPPHPHAIADSGVADTCSPWEVDSMRARQPTISAGHALVPQVQWIGRGVMGMENAQHDALESDITVANRVSTPRDVAEGTSDDPPKREQRGTAVDSGFGSLQSVNTAQGNGTLRISDVYCSFSQALSTSAPMRKESPAHAPKGAGAITEFAVKWDTYLGNAFEINDTLKVADFLTY